MNVENEAGSRKYKYTVPLASLNPHMRAVKLADISEYAVVSIRGIHSGYSLAVVLGFS
jgi:hypothetical protein